MKNNLTLQDGETSYFSDYYAVQSVLITWDKVYQLIVSDTLKKHTERYRHLLLHGFKKEAEKLKKKSCGITPAVVCSGARKAGNILHYTGFCMADLDHLPAEDLPRCLSLLKDDPYVFLAYRTISGAGLRVIFRADSDGKNYKTAYSQGNAYFATLLGYPYDRQCSDASRLCGLCHDPQAVYRPDAKVMPVDLTVSKKKPAGRPRKVFHASAAEVEEKVLSEIESDGKTYEPGRRNEYVSAALYAMNRFGVAEEETLQWALSRFADYGAENIEPVVRSVYRNTAEHGKRKISERPETSRCASIEELETFILSQADIRYNIILGRREIRMKDDDAYSDLTDENENTLWLRARKAGLPIGQSTFLSILNSEFIEHFDPFDEYFTSLFPWDGKTDYIARLADRVETTTPELFRKYFRMWMVGLVAGIIDKRVVNQSVLTLIGEQGKYKTSWLSHLLPVHLNRYFYTKANSSKLTKDDLFTLAEYALICYEELDDMSNADLNQLKALITMPYVNERAAYARNRSFRPHVASLCATGNNRYFLRDRTGYRRWFVFEVLNIVDPYTHPVDHDRVYAQALALFRSGFRYWVTEEDIRELNNHNTQFEIPNLEMELIHLYYRVPKPCEQSIVVSNSEILQKITLGLKNSISQVNIGMGMKKLGFQSVHKKKVRGYLVIERSSQEILDRKNRSCLPD